MADLHAAVLNGYLTTALWASTDNSDDSGGDPLDKNYGIEDIAPESLAKARADCERFLVSNADALGSLAMKQVIDWSTIGHDFWLTRNGHGAGFWDGDYPEPEASVLTASCKTFGELYPIVGDSGDIHLE